ncbi:MAG: hypothetical protein M1484_02125 [Patescibacteria group bacterium]|nr:hypothetical protein [Patescibacteria group bacterium]MCL5431878.1 hypothetical protein [Patescibacteria group bacterium]
MVFIRPSIVSGLLVDLAAGFFLTAAVPPIIFSNQAILETLTVTARSIISGLVCLILSESVLQAEGGEL